MDKKLCFSYDNSRRVIELSSKVGSMFDLVVQDMGKKGIHEANKAIYEAAEAQEISVWDLCYMVAPSIDTDVETLEDGTARMVRTIRLIPIEFEFDKGPGYWKGKYYELKRQMQAIIDNKEI